ncbi:macrophage migration inhibitory factor-like [Anolis carolinensis]|uniref:macrophage migration inhibitory factor-like n=1 Tax=Anolis carolinensis TaxID=28377 RepID=UPI002F2B63F9
MLWRLHRAHGSAEEPPKDIRCPGRTCTAMYWAGFPVALASCSVISEVRLSGMASKLLCSLLQDKLHVPPDRVYINYYDMNAANVGWNGSTFA